MFKNFFVFMFLISLSSKTFALNVFELSAISLGGVIILDQFFDRSLSANTEYQKKKKILRRFKKESFIQEMPDLGSRDKLIHYLNVVESLHNRF